MSLIKEEEGRDICRGEESIFGFIIWGSGAVRVGGGVRFAGEVIKGRIRNAQKLKQRLKCSLFILFYFTVSCDLGT